MNEGDGPCMLPHHKERLLKSYENELEHFNKMLERLEKFDKSDVRVATAVHELEVKRDLADKRIEELSHIPLCVPIAPAPAAPAPDVPASPAPQPEPQPPTEG